jgi:hypothetical protein
MKLTSEQVRLIEHSVTTGNVKIITLRDDLVDHICCSVEHKLQRGNSFDCALRESLKELAPDGLEQLELETIKLLNSKSIPMKKFMYLLGLVTTICWAVGFTFRILGWPGGVELSDVGFLTFAFVFLPMFLYNSYRQRIKRTIAEKLRMAFGFLSGVITAIAVFFKAMHYPGADILLLTGGMIFSFGFLPCLFYTMYVKSTQIASN